MNIQQLHNDLYGYLSNAHKGDKSFRFRVRRMNNQNRLLNGYWFNGNDSYLETSFWDYKDNLHQTPIIRLVYSFETKQWRSELIGRDNKERAAYFGKMADTLGFKNDGRTPVWKKELIQSQQFLEPVEQFIKNEKKEIDNYLNKNEYDENIIGFIKELNFEKDINRIDSYKHQGKIVNQDNDKVRIPYALTNIEIDKFIGGKQLSLTKDEDSNIPKNIQWIFFTGENGFGKTSVLRAIAKGLTEDNTKGIEVFGFKDGAYYSNLLEDSIDYKPMDKVVGYGVSRFMRIDEMNGNINDNTSLKTVSLFSDYAKLISIENALVNTYLEQETERKNGFKITTYESIVKVFQKILPKITIKVERFEKEAINKRWQVRYFEKDDANQIFKDINGKEISVELDNLAAGYKGILTMIGDMMIHLTNNFKESPEHISGIVLIDEFDAHLHPKYQYELPKFLTEAFPEVQFIVSTHSPIPLLGLPKKTKFVVFKVNRTAEEGIILDRLDDDIEIRKLSANALLTSDIFGFETIFARDATPETVQPFDNYKDIQEMNELEKLLELKEGFKKLRIKI